MLSLLFDAAARPDALAIQALAANAREFSISHDPNPAASLDHWMELLVNGLTFDLKGLAPGAGRAVDVHPHHFDLPHDFIQSAYRAVTLEPGPHLAGGEAMLPVVRSQLLLALQLSELPGLAAIGWRPARCLSSPGHFRHSITSWLEGGPFPGFGLTALLPVPDGGIQSEGLAFFTGQELLIEPDLALDGTGAARIALRLIHELVERGGLDGRERAIGPAGESLRLTPSPNGRYVRVSRL